MVASGHATSVQIHPHSKKKCDLTKIKTCQGPLQKQEQVCDANTVSLGVAQSFAVLQASEAVNV